MSSHGWHAMASTMGAALALTFVLPSCFTFGVWRQGNRPTRHGIRADAAEGIGHADAPRLLCRLVPRDGAALMATASRDRSVAALAALWQPPLALGAWLAIEPTEHKAEVARLWRELPDRCGLQLVRDPDSASPRCWFVCSADPFAALPDELASLPGVQVRAGMYGTKVLTFEAECQVTLAEPPAAAIDTEIAMRHCDPPPSTAVRLLSTPLTLVIDGVLLPFELLGIAAWW